MGKETKKEIKKQRKKMQKRTANRQNKYTMIAIAGVVCMLFGVLLYGSNELRERIDENQKKIEALELGIAEQQRRTDEITEMGEQMQSEEFIESVAQGTFGMVKENQIIIKPEK